MIKLEKIQKEYKNKRRNKIALNSISLEINNGMVFIVGESGSGKTTLINLVSFQDEQTSGDIFINGKNTKGFSLVEKQIMLNKNIAIIYQDFNLIEDFTILDNIILPLKLQNKKIDEKELEETLKRLNLDQELLYSYPNEISGGQQQRVAIARAIIKDASIIIADEPTGSLDNKNAVEVMNILKELSNDRVVLVVSHNLDLASKYANRIIELENGKVINDNVFKEDKIETKVGHLVDIKQRPKLLFYDSFKLALSNIKNKWLRTILSLITLTLVLAFLLTALSFSNYDKDKATQRLIKDENVSYFSIARHGKPNDDSIINFNFSEYELDYFGSELGENQLIGISSNLYCVRDSLNANMEISREDLPNSIRGHIDPSAFYITEDIMKEFKFKYLGDIPQNAEKEIMISNYLCYVLGWIELKDVYNENILNEVIKTKTYQIQSTDFKVVGIIISLLDFWQDHDDGSTSTDYSK